MTEEAAWILAWFEGRGAVPGDTPEKKLQTQYFNAGLVDSMSVIELITDVEERFGIQFSDTHFQERRFATIGGLCEIVQELAAAAT